jgi:hypothetical protein
MKLSFVLPIAMGLSVSLSAGAQVVSAETLEQKIQHAGARGVVSDLAQNKAEWSQVLDHVASGDSAWLKVAEDLKPATKAELTETLDGAVTAAIQRNPDGVLEILGPVFKVSEVCRAEGVEGNVEPPKVVLKRTREALEGVTRPALATRRYECLQELPQTEEATAEPQ